MASKNQTKSPIIGITSMLHSIESGCFLGYKRAAVGQRYVDAIHAAGGIPLILPIVEGKESIAQQLEVIDGLLFSGGDDISPLFYNDEPQQGLGPTCPERDRYEIHLFQMARHTNKPILGICRGLQLMNVAMGGTLYQDIPSTIPSPLIHQQQTKADEATHAVNLISETKLHRIMDGNALETNSFHHQAIKGLATGLVPNAYSSDGLIEGIEGKEESYLLGVQWHPEYMFSKDPKMLKLFQTFVDAAQTRKMS